MTPEEKADKFFDWCVNNDSIPIVRAYLGALDCIGGLDKYGAPKRMMHKAVDLRDYFESQISKFRGDSR